MVLGTLIKVYSLLYSLMLFLERHYITKMALLIFRGSLNSKIPRLYSSFEAYYEHVVTPKKWVGGHFKARRSVFQGSKALF